MESTPASLPESAFPGSSVSNSPRPSLTSLASWLLVGKLISFAFSLLLPLLLVRRLSKEEFGLYKQAFLAVGTAIVILPLGFSMSAYYFLPREPKNGGQVMLNVLLFHTLVGSVALLVLMLYPALLRLIFNSADLEPYAPQIGLVILLWVIAYFLETAVVANQESRLAAAFIISAQFSKTAFMVLATVFLASLSSLLYAAILQGIVQTALLIAYLNWRFPGFWRHFDRSLFKRQLSYAIPFGLAGSVYTLETDYHNYFISNRFGPVNFAVYSIGCLDIPLVTFLSEAVGSVMIPRAATLQRENNQRELVLLTVRAMRKLALVFLPIYAFLMVSGRDFIVTLFTARYASSWPLFAINLTLLPFATLVTDPLVRAYADQRYFLLRLHIVLFASMIVALWFAVNDFGMLGAVGVIVGINVIARLWMAVRMARVIGVDSRDWTLLSGFARVAAAAALAACVTAGLRRCLPPMTPFFSLISCGICYTAAYLLAIVLMKVPEEDERAIFRRVTKRLAQRWS